MRHIARNRNTKSQGDTMSVNWSKVIQCINDEMAKHNYKYHDVDDKEEECERKYQSG